MIGRLDEIQSGQVPTEDLAITQSLSRDPSEYIEHTLNVIVAQQLVANGGELIAGQNVRYMIIKHKSKVRDDRVRALIHVDGTLGYIRAVRGIILVCRTSLEEFALGQRNVNFNLKDHMQI